MTQIAIYIDTPYLSPAEFAKRTGQKEQHVLSQCKDGKYPLKPRNSNKEKIMINNALLIKHALEQEADW